MGCGIAMINRGTTTVEYHCYFLQTTWGLIKIIIKMHPSAIAGAILIFVVLYFFKLNWKPVSIK